MMSLRTCLFLLPVSAALLGCTPEIRHHANKMQYEMATYDYGQVWNGLSGGHFPTFAQAEQQQLMWMCWHPDTERRVIKVNEVNDQFYYTRCTLTPYPPVKPHRMQGKPGYVAPAPDYTMIP